MNVQRSAASAWLALALVGFASPLWAQGSDSCATPEPLGGFGDYSFSTLGATTDGLPAVICNAFSSSQIHNDVWFCWTADANGFVSIATCGATFDTRLAVYQGCGACPDESTIIACNDDSCALQSRVEFQASAGTSYMLRVGAFAVTGFGSGPLTIGSAFLADITNPANGHRYVALTATSWSAASDLAGSLGGYLVSITSEAEQNFVWSEFGNLLGVDRRVWIGFNDVGSEGTFEWTSGERANYTNWNSGEPNNAGNNEHYAELLGSNGKWNDLPNSGAGLPHIAVIEFDSGSACVADVNGSGDVDPTDLAVILGAWGGRTPDLDGDGIVGASDLALLLGAWGPCPG
jgi:Lectin C-type domain